jgi:hypothetical protein
MHFYPATFEEYCARILVMLDVYKNIPIFHYEDFIQNPDEILVKLCDALSINYDDFWPGIFDIAQVTGDSGRAGNTITPRPRRAVEESFSNEIQNSTSFACLASKFNY